MYKDRSILGIIPARGGSKGLPGKNIREMSGKPLIAWTVEKAVSSQYLDKVIVTTDDKSISDIAIKFGAEVPFIRPMEISGDKTPMIDVVSHAIDYLKEQGTQFDYVALLEPTSPLRKNNDIDRAIEQMISFEDKADGLVSVGEVHLEHPSIMKEFSDGYIRPYLTKAENVSRRQDLGKVYFPYGVIYLVKTDKLLGNRTFYQDKTIPFFIERWQNYEIDDIYDFLCIEAVMKHQLKESCK